MTLIRDNNPSGPEVEVVRTVSMSKSISDSEPFQEKVYLSCGHHLYNTFGVNYKIKQLGEKLKCRLCGEKI